MPLTPTYRDIGTGVFPPNTIADPSTLACTAPSGRVAGDLLLCATWCRSITATVATPSGWTLVSGFPRRSGTASGGSIYLFSRYADGTSSDNCSPSWSGVTTGTSGDASGAVIIAYQNTSATLDVAPNTTGLAAQTTSSVITGLTTNTANSLVLVLAMKLLESAGQTSTVDWTERYDNQTTSGTGHIEEIGEKVVVSPSLSGNATITWSAATSARALGSTLAFLAATQGTKAQTAKLSVQNTATKTQSARVRVSKTFTAAQTAKSRIQNTAVTKAQTAKLSVQNTATKTQSARVRVSKTFTAAQTAKLRVSKMLTAVQTARARIGETLTAAQSTRARVSASVTMSQSSSARVQKTIVVTQIARARVQLIRTSTQAALSRIQTTVTVPQTARARIATTRTVAHLARARISVPFATTQSSSARIQRALQARQHALSRIQSTVKSTQAARVRLQTVLTASQPATARVATVVFTYQTSTARLGRRHTVAQTAIARIAVLTVDNTEPFNRPAGMGEFDRAIATSGGFRRPLGVPATMS